MARKLLTKFAIDVLISTYPSKILEEYDEHYSKHISGDMLEVRVAATYHCFPRLLWNLRELIFFGFLIIFT